MGERVQVLVESEVQKQLRPAFSTSTLSQVLQSTTTQITPSKNQIDTSNWKTYRNEEYGFEVDYPTEWQVVLDSSNNFRLSSPTCWPTGIPVETPDRRQIPVSCIELSFTVLPNPWDYTLKDFVEHRLFPDDLEVHDVLFTDLEFTKYPALYVRYSSDTYIDGLIVETYLFKLFHDVLTVSPLFQESNRELQVVSVIRKILSTAKKIKE